MRESECLFADSLFHAVEMLPGRLEDNEFENLVYGSFTAKSGHAASFQLCLKLFQICILLKTGPLGSVTPAFSFCDQLQKRCAVFYHPAAHNVDAAGKKRVRKISRRGADN